MSEKDCIFCQIAAGDAPAHKLYEDVETVAFMDIFPWAKGHSLVIPKQHFENIFEGTEEGLTAVMKTVRIVAPALKSAVDAEGMNLFQSNGRAAWQTVDHFHIHLIPRWHNDALQPPGAPSPADESLLKEVTDRVSQALKS